jgi:hypothetical protein
VDVLVRLLLSNPDEVASGSSLCGLIYLRCCRLANALMQVLACSP